MKKKKMKKIAKNKNEQQQRYMGVGMSKKIYIGSLKKKKHNRGVVFQLLK